MKLVPVFLIAFFLCSGCGDRQQHKEHNTTVVSKERPIGIDDIEVLKKDLILNQLEGKWYYKNEPFSGYSLKFYPNDTLGERLGFHNGKREGIAKKWSENGVLRIESYYRQNRLDSVYTSWWENGKMASRSNYVNGVKQGLENEWYPTGQLAKERQLIDGKENGLQRAWLQNGKMYVNYEARNGRIFGMRRANSCYKLEDENINRDTKI